MEHRVRRGASSADASGLAAGVLCRRHVSAGLGRGVGRNRPSGGTGCGPRGRRDQGIGAEGAPEKSEAMWFCRRADHGTPPVGYRLRMEGAEIEVGTSMKYLGLTLDSHWTFRSHFERLVPSVEATANALRRLQPRLGGPGVGVRCLYTGVVRSRLLYGAPIWAEDLMASRRSLLKIRRLHRTVAIRVARGFRTISAAATAVLAVFSPLELQAL